jgi:hypothetical protein
MRIGGLMKAAPSLALKRFQSAFRNPKSEIARGRLPDGARLGTMAVALEGEIRNREAGVARLNRKKLREVGSKRRE